MKKKIFPITVSLESIQFDVKASKTGGENF
jgi:hypothetical protein